MSRGDRLRDLAALAFLALVVTVLCQGVLRGSAGLGPEVRLDGDALYGHGSPAWRPYDDVTPLVLETPRDRHFVERVRAGHLDLWNPLQGTGVPLAPDQGGLFSPLRLVHIALPSRTGYVLFHAIRLWIAAAGAFYLARRRGLSRLGATLAGTAFGLSGGMVAQLPFACAAPPCLLPWLLVAQGDLLEKPSAWARALVGLAVALTLTSGHPTVAASVLAGALAHGVFCAARKGPARARHLLDLGIGWALGVAFAAPYLVAFAEYVTHAYSYKHTGEGIREHGVWRDYMRAQIGEAIAAPSTLDALRESLPKRAYPYALHFVAGTVAWVLACSAALRRRVTADLYALAALGLLLTIEPPPFGLAVHVPLWRDILPRYHWQLVVLPVAIAAGAGADGIASAERDRTWGELRSLAGAALLFAGVALAALGLGAFGADAYPTPWPKLLASLKTPQPPLWSYHLAALGAIALVAVAARFALRGRGAILLFAAAADALFLMRPHLSDKPAEALRAPVPSPVLRLAAATAAAHARMLGADTRTSMAPLPSLAGIADLRMTAPLVPARYEAFLRAAGAGTAFTYFSLPKVGSPFADLAAARFIVAEPNKRAEVAADGTLEVRETLPHATVFESPSAFGRARLFFGAAVAKGRDDAAALLKQLAKGGSHIGGTALGEVVVVEPAGDVAPAPLAGKGSADVRWIRDEADEVIVQTDGSAAGYLMLADTYYPGWRATVDGASATIFPADVGFRAVAVPPGEHVVRFVYQPRSLAVGFGILAAAAAVAAFGVRRERARRVVA